MNSTNRPLFFLPPGATQILFELYTHWAAGLICIRGSGHPSSVPSALPKESVSLLLGETFPILGASARKTALAFAPQLLNAHVENWARRSSDSEPCLL